MPPPVAKHGSSGKTEYPGHKPEALPLQEQSRDPLSLVFPEPAHSAWPSHAVSVNAQFETTRARERPA
jgi:hypothetical protein